MTKDLSSNTDYILVPAKQADKVVKVLSEDG